MADALDPNDFGTDDDLLVGDATIQQLTEAVERPGQITIHLPYKVEFNRKTYEQLIVHEPVAADVLFGEMAVKDQMNAWTVRNRQINLIARCAKVEVGVVMRLKMRHFNEAWGYISPFFDFGLEIHGK